MARRSRRLRIRLPRDPRLAAAWVVAFILLAILGRWLAPDEPVPRAETQAAVTARVKRVIDGDTFVLANDERIRLIGADTPETVQPNHPVEPWGPEATEFTRRFVLDREVRLEYDGPRKDQFNRTLAHVWVGDRMLGEELVRAGLATAETRYDYSDAMKDRLKAAEAEARAARRGIWSGASGSLPAGDTGP